MQRRPYLKPAQLERLKEHKYRSQGTSLFEPVLQVYWRWLVTKLPMWMAPNLITFLGLLINIVTTIPIIIYDYNMEGLAPSWSYVICALGFFLYQSLDAIDGKQARRTGTNNPLGELFDHGCDAISGFIVLISALSAMGMQELPMTMIGFALLLMVLNFFYHWQTYVSGVLHFKTIDVTEAQFLHMAVLTFMGVMGPQVWHYQLPYVEMRLKVLVIGISYAVSVLNALIALRIILTSGVGKNGSTVADTSVLSPLIIPLCHVPVVLLYCSYSLTPLNSYCLLFLTAMVFPMVKAIIQLLVASMTKSPLPLVDISLLGPVLALANVYWGQIVPELYLLTAVVIYNLVDVTILCCSLCQQICDFLDISCFTIPPPQPQPQAAATDKRMGNNNNKTAS